MLSVFLAVPAFAVGTTGLGNINHFERLLISSCCTVMIVKMSWLFVRILDCVDYDFA